MDKFKPGDPVIYNSIYGKSYRAKVKGVNPGGSIIIQFYVNNDQLMNAAVKPGRLILIKKCDFSDLFKKPIFKDRQ